MAAGVEGKLTAKAAGNVSVGFAVEQTIGGHRKAIDRLAVAAAGQMRPVNLGQRRQERVDFPLLH